MRIKLFLIITLLLVILLPSHGQSKVFDLKNQLSLQTGINFSDEAKTAYMALRYIPTFNITGDFKKDRSIDAELSLNSYANFYYTGGGLDEYNWKARPYRLWIRYSSPRFELRAGLQKISFGSAYILRPMMWFDKIDFRDPLQLTDGVYGLLGRYYFQGNVNIWFWALYGNENTKGWEVAPTQKQRAEYGGRFQVPLFTGELAASYHYRRADYSAFYVMQPAVSDPYFTDQLLGVDGKWDIGVGLWFEYSLKINDKENILFEEDEHYINIGLDYTFGLGNGLNIITEYFRYESNMSNNYSVISANYPFGLMNRMIAAVYYNWDTEDLYRFISFQRDTDYWSFNLMAFWNPEGASIYSSSSDRNLMSGTGMQFIAILNF